ncbi:alpha-amylase MalA [Candidatus Halobonum tyrrellensis]|uniref:Alpha amylase n=1 Tax=Candidatus Halobonum tyrrellensis G22 TaxID=1324957 RepID=V4HJN1_9EURY|nr:alpha-amylase MalA [Candidatus Halobonum tyrrellensis]ESP88124.1 alpha amylase [Candidatus Halobonum tyrrellensis G22]
MHHPGPPRFVAVGHSVELAPRDPDPDATYRWRVAEAPVASVAELGDDPVVHFVPDAPGTYVVELRAPDGTHRLTVRAFPGELSPEGVAGGASGRSGQWSGGSGGAGGRSGASGSARSGSGSGTGTREGEHGAGRPRVRLEARVAGDELVVEATVRAAAGESPDDADVEFVVDDRDDLPADAATVGDREFRVPVSALPGRLRVHAVAVGAGGYSVADSVDVRTDDGDGVRTDGGTASARRSVETTRPYDPPEWATDALIYEIYVRTFAPDDDDSATTFDAIAARLDYLDDLGVDVLWLTPVLQNDHAPHGYNITDFFAIAEDLGGREAYERFLDAAHDRGMKVLFDLVCNHSARAHPFFEDAYRNPDSEYYDWYEWQESGEPGTYFDWEYIANFDFDTLDVRRHLLDAVDEWAPLVDGFRCDMAWAVPNGFWKELHDRVKARDPEFLLLDETIPYIADFQEGMFDMHFDSTTAFTLREVGAGHQPAERLLDAIDARVDAGFPDHASFMLYAENHDESRYITECGEPAARAAAGALMTLPGTPMLYAGQELGQRGRRDGLAWEHANPHLQEQYARLVDARHAHPALEHDAALRRVGYEVRDGPADRVVAYGRAAPDGGEAVVVVLNFADETATVAIDPAVGAVDVATGDRVAEGGAVTVEDATLLPADADTL